MSENLPDLPSLADLEEKLLNARCRLMTREPWYGHIGMAMEWIPSQMLWEEDERAKTMGVRIVNGGVVQCIWYPGFVHRQTIQELYGVIMHEIEHIVRCHCLRVGPGREPMRWNVAADMIVNGKKAKPICAYYEPSLNEYILPVGGNGVYFPEDWDQSMTTEQVYDKVGGVFQKCPKCGGAMNRCQGGKGNQSGKAQKAQKAQKGQGQQGAGQGQKGQQQPGQNGSGGSGNQPGDPNGDGSGGPPQHTCSNCGGATCPNGHATTAPGQYEYGDYSGQQIDSHQIWGQTDVSEDEARQLVKDMTDQATAKCQGVSPGHLTQVLKDLAKPVVHWRELLRQYIGNHVGNRRSTYSRRNRRQDTFGMPGISHHAAGRVVVIVDTSGSISDVELAQFFSEIEMISSRAKVSVLQWDFAFQGYGKYRRGDWKKWQVKGRGGTDMAAPVKWLTENRQVEFPDCVIMLTDGYCNWSPKQDWFPERGMITVITAGQDTVSSPEWGHIIYMKNVRK